MATFNNWCCGGGAVVAAEAGTLGPGATVCKGVSEVDDAERVVAGVGATVS
jgi:hypothetical protein